MNSCIVRAAPLTRPLAQFSALSQAYQRAPRPCILSHWLRARGLTTPLAASPTPPQTVPLRKRLKDGAKLRKAKAKATSAVQNASKAEQGSPAARLEKWELSVGVEIHAELNTGAKLFSSAPASLNAAPNTNVALFDAAMPGTQPCFQNATLLPAVRAALALDCEVQRKSAWDRKHYFHWDQPNGYQITQYYEPFAKNGHLTLHPHDGVSPSDLNGAESLRIGIKQIQMEQDTAKTTLIPPSTYHIDLNRAGLPLIEIITLPHIHSPANAAAVVRKIQAVLKAVDACATGMELGGLRADVNVSIRKRGTEGEGRSYSGVGGLGQRTEIKNLSSFKAVEEAVIAERDRQIGVLEAGGKIEGETRGWTLGAAETTRLRGKEGEVDYRYMPDADLPPLFIGSDLVQHLTNTLPELPDETVKRICSSYGVTLKDAKTLVALDDGDRLEFLEETVALLSEVLGGEVNRKRLGKMAGNWVLHEIGGLLTTSNTSWEDMSISPRELADVLANLDGKQITARAAKQLLGLLHDLPAGGAAPRKSVEQVIEENRLRLKPLSDEEYKTMAKQLMDENAKMVEEVRAGQHGKIMWFVGQMMRREGAGSVEPEKARKILEQIFGT